MTVFVDLDGVLADFEAGFERRYKRPVHGLSKADLDEYKKIFAMDEFFLHLPMYEGANEFLDAVIEIAGNSGHDVQILTSVSKFESDTNAAHKSTWVDANIIHQLPFNWVYRSEDKSLHATSPHDILIDDRDKSLDAWAANGRQCVPHIPGQFDQSVAVLAILLESGKTS